MLSKRFINNNTSSLKLNTLQESIKKDIDRKIKEGIYTFEDVLCPICEREDFDLLSEMDRYGLYLSVKICKICGLIQTNPRMTPSSYSDFYKYEQKKLYVGKEKPDSKYFLKQYNRGKEIYDYMIGFFNKKEFNVLEVGCASGGILQFFREKGCCILGCDLNEEYINYGKNNYGLELYNSEFQQIELPWRPDLIILSHTLEHILEPIKELRNLRNVSNKDTLLYIEVPGIKNLQHSYNQDLLQYLQNAHVYHFTLGSLVNLLNKAGWDLIEGSEYIKSVFRILEIPILFKSDFKKSYEYLQKLEEKFR